MNSLESATEMHIKRTPLLALCIPETTVGGSTMNLENLGQGCPPNYVLIVFPKGENLDHLLRTVIEAGDIPLICHSFEEAQEVIKYENIQIIICEDHLPRKSIEGIMQLARNHIKPTPVIITSRTGEWREFLEALQQGAFDYLALPPWPSEVKRVLQLARAEVAGNQASSALAGSPETLGRQPGGYGGENRWSDSPVQRYAAAANNSVPANKFN